LQMNNNRFSFGVSVDDLYTIHGWGASVCPPCDT
jgi:hypothetical protein